MASRAAVIRALTVVCVEGEKWEGEGLEGGRGTAIILPLTKDRIGATAELARYT